MLLLTTQDKATMLILDRLSAVVEINKLEESDFTNKINVYKLGLTVYTAKHKFEVCSKSVVESSVEYRALNEKIRQLKIDIVEAYRKYRDNLTTNQFNDEYYYIDYDFVLRKVNETKETL